MIISSTWVEIAIDGCILQKHGTNPLKLAYGTVEPTTQDSFGVHAKVPQIFPDVYQKSLWAIAVNGDVSITVEDVIT